ncbi:hypothetical protein [Sporomusa aerivorans]|uniref:hypothetical protein n=1 Tax=Sporomusa aerivorans TaxID=204936 RepID=UPI003529FD67
MAIDSKLMYGTYSYSIIPASGDIGTVAFDDSASSLTVHKGVRTTYSSTNSTPIGPDPKPLFFKNGAGLNRAAVASLVWSGTTATCTWLFYAADADNTSPNTWGDPVAGPVTLTVGTKTVTNPYCIRTREVSSGVVDIYGIDYDGKFVFRVRSSGTNGDTYTVQSGAYVFPDLTDDNESYGVDLEITGEYVYALFINGKNLSAGAPTAAYVDSTVVKLDFALSTTPVAYIGPYTSLTGSGWPAPNAFSIQAYGSDLILTAVGGPQHGGTTSGQWNTASRIQKVNQSTLAVTNLLKAAQSASDPASDKYDFRALSFSSDGSTAYILIGTFNSSWVMDWYLYATSMATLTGASNVLLSSLVAAGKVSEVSSTVGEDGYYWALWFSNGTGKTWMAQGNDLAVYDMGGSIVSAGGITALSTFTSVADGLNFATIYEGETATVTTLKSYVAPAFASNSAQALFERERFIKEVAAAKAKS